MGKLSGIPVWCFTGPELGEKEKEIQNILSEVRAEFGTVDEYSFYPEETPVPQIVQILLNGSLFSAGKFIVVNEAHTIKDGSVGCFPGGKTHVQVTAPGYPMYCCWIIRHLDGDPWLKTRIVDERYAWLEK